MEGSGQSQAPVALHLGKSTVAYWVGGWVVPGFDLDVLEKRCIFFAPAGILTPERPVRSPLIY
jgi:hypothetical protein